jgi:hypothetical protein
MSSGLPIKPMNLNMNVNVNLNVNVNGNNVVKNKQASMSSGESSNTTNPINCVLTK